MSNTLHAFFIILGVGIGFFLLDFVTDIQFSFDMQSMVARNITEEIRNCSRKFEKLNAIYTNINCSTTNDNMKEMFNCMNFLSQLQQEARKCFNRGQHFGFQNMNQFQYMRNNF